MQHTDHAPTRAALWVLILVQAIMLLALLADLEPHPPRTIVLFAMAPFLATSIAVCVAALQMVGRGWGKGLAGLAGVLALLSYGPQKYFDPAFAEIWPAVIAAQIAVFALVFQIVKSQQDSAVAHSAT